MLKGTDFPSLCPACTGASSPVPDGVLQPGGDPGRGLGNYWNWKPGISPIGRNSSLGQP